MTRKRIKKLTFRTKLEIFPSQPFHFNSTFYKPDHFASNDTAWKSERRWQTMLWQKQKLGLIFEDAGIGNRPKVLVKIFSAQKLSSQFLEELEQEIVWRYNLKLNLSEFYKQVGKDPLLKPIIKKFRGLRPMHPGSLYEYLIIAVVLQNATVKRSVSMMQGLFENYGTPLFFDKKKLWCFWQPKTLAKAKEQELRDLKMGYRAKFLIKVSEPFANNEINELKLRKETPEKQEQALISLYGIGPASVGYIMFDVFHNWGYLKHISPWEQKIYTKIFFDKDHEKGLVPTEQMLQYFDKWDKWKNLAIHYVWQDIWWQRRNKNIPWLEKLIRM